MVHNSEVSAGNMDELFVFDKKPSHDYLKAQNYSKETLNKITANSKPVGGLISRRKKLYGCAEPSVSSDLISIQEDKTPKPLSSYKSYLGCKMENRLKPEENGCNMPSLDSLGVIEDKEGLFTGQKTNIPIYKIKDIFQCPQSRNDTSHKTLKFSPACWNCNERSHSLRDCQQPRDTVKIARARKEFQDFKGVNWQGYRRYHLNESQLYDHLVPGKISDELAAALGLEYGQLPSYIYMMRRLGYPPGWLCEATVSRSGIELLVGSEKDVFTEEKCRKHENCVNSDKYDVSKFIRYPGFNAPPPPNTYDESAYWGVPPLSINQSLEVMTERLQGQLAEEQSRKRKKLSFGSTSVSADVNSSQHEYQEMDYEFTLDSADLPEDDCRFVPALPEDLPTPPPLPPALQHLISPYSKYSTSFGPNLAQSAISADETSLEVKLKNKNKLVAEINDISPICATPRSKVGKTKSVDLGTPIIKRISSFPTLPSAEKFSLDICDVIHFENLPNSTGKYKQMSRIIGKVRTKLAVL